MRYVRCNLCGYDQAEPLNQGPDLLLNIHEPIYQLVRCRNCGLIYQKPQATLEELRDLSYPPSYICYHTGPQQDDHFLTRIDQHFGIEQHCDRITRRCPGPGNLLDVGCGTGVLMDAMRARNWQVSGVEIGKYPVAYARQVYKLDVFSGTLEEASYPGRSFHLVTLWGVLEHVPDPKATLIEVARVLKPNGMVVIAVPNPTCLEAKLFGPSWVGWDRPRHLHLFTPPVMHRYLSETGFVPEGIESFFGHLRITLLNIEFWCKTNGIPEKKWKPLLSFLYNWPLRVLTWPIYKIGEAMNQTTNMVVFARKREQ